MYVKHFIFYNFIVIHIYVLTIVVKEKKMLKRVTNFYRLFYLDFFAIRFLTDFNSSKYRMTNVYSE